MIQIVLPEGTDYGTFVIPSCPECLLENRPNDVQKPEVIFFGESIPAAVKDKSYDRLQPSLRFLTVQLTYRPGLRLSTLATGYLLLALRSPHSLLSGALISSATLVACFQRYSFPLVVARAQAGEARPWPTQTCSAPQHRTHARRRTDGHRDHRGAGRFYHA